MLRVLLFSALSALVNWAHIGWCVMTPKYNRETDCACMCVCVCALLLLIKIETGRMKLRSCGYKFVCLCVRRGLHNQEVDWTQSTDITILSDMRCQGYTQGQTHITKPSAHKHSHARPLFQFSPPCLSFSLFVPFAQAYCQNSLAPTEDIMKSYTLKWMNIYK